MTSKKERGAHALITMFAVFVMALTALTGAVMIESDVSEALDTGSASSPLSSFSSGVSECAGQTVYVKIGTTVSITFESGMEVDGSPKDSSVSLSDSNKISSSFGLSGTNLQSITGTISKTGTFKIYFFGDGDNESIPLTLISVAVASTVPVTSITISGESAPIYAGSTATLSANVQPSNATDRSVSWSSSNTSVATVDSSGLVTAKSAGTAIITATANDGSGVSNTKSITVKALTVSLSGSTSGYTATQYSYTVSSNAGKASLNVSPTSGWGMVSSGSTYKLTFNTAGTYTLTATATNGSVTDTKTLTVNISQKTYSYSVVYYVDGSAVHTQGPESSTDTSYGMTLDYAASAGTNEKFKGWATSSGGSVSYQKSGSVTLYSTSPTLNLYAVFEYTPSLTFNANGGSNIPSAISKTSSTKTAISVDIPATEPAFNGHIFQGWSITNGGSPEYASASSSLYAANPTLKTSYQLGYNESATLYAVWATAYTSTLKYDVGDATFSGSDTTTDPTTSTAGVTIQITSAVPVSTYGYVFKGWALADGEDPVYGNIDGLQTSIAVGAGRTVTLYAVWYVKVTYDGNGGTPSKISDEIKVGNLALLPTANKASTATKVEGGEQGTTYELLGWSTDPNSADADSEYTAGARVTFKKSVTLYAIWKEKEGTTYYTVTFDPNGGKCDTGKLEGVVNALPTASRDDSAQDVAGGRAVTSYKLLGWSEDQSSKTADNTAGSRFVPTENTVLYAIWEAEIVTTYYTVTFDPNGGKCDIGKLEGVISSIPSATRENSRTDLGGGYTDIAYTFLGWATSKDAVIADPAYVAGGSLTPASDMTLFAVWKADSTTTVYTLTYDPCNGEDVRVDDFAGETVKLARTVKSWGFTKEGYTLTGWSETEGSETAEYRTGDQIAVSKDTTIYAVWVDATKVVYTAYLKYDANGGDSAPSDQNIVGTDQENRVFTVTSITPVKQNCQFVGWSETKGADTAKYQPGDKIIVAYDGERTLYAVWTSAKATVNFDANGGTSVGPIIVNQGEKFELPSSSKDGMDLEGWYLGDKRVGGTGDFYVVGSDVTLKAQWKEHTDSDDKGLNPIVLIFILIIAGLIIAKVAGVF